MTLVATKGKRQSRHGSESHDRNSQHKIQRKALSRQAFSGAVDASVRAVDGVIAVFVEQRRIRVLRTRRKNALPNIRAEIRSDARDGICVGTGSVRGCGCTNTGTELAGAV